MLIESVAGIATLVREYGRTPGCISIRFLDAKQEFIRRLTIYEALTLTAACKVVAKTDKHGNLENLRLRPKVSAKSASRILNPMQVGACNGITKRKQGNGNKNWVPHFEKSEGGWVGASRRLISPMDFPDRRYAIGRAIGPVRQTA